VTAAGGRLLRYRADAPAATIVFGTAVWMVVGAAGLIPLWSIVFLPLALRWVGVIQHNHTHVPLFRQSTCNRMVDVALTFVSAVPQSLYRHLHVDVHHRFVNTPKDWTGPFYRAGTSFPERPVPFSQYCLTTTARCWRRGMPTVWRRERAALVVCCLPAAVVLIGLMIASPAGAAVFLLAPWVATAVFLPATNWRQHSGCTYQSPSTSANVNFGVLHGVLAFNIGYHSAHHIRPAAHWTKLPELHARFIAASLPTACRRHGIFAEAAGSVRAASDRLLVRDRRDRATDGGEQREHRCVDVDPLPTHTLEKERGDLLLAPAHHLRG
jgi:fatty acid desaturase